MPADSLCCGDAIVGMCEMSEEPGALDGTTARKFGLQRAKFARDSIAPAAHAETPCGSMRNADFSQDTRARCGLGARSSEEEARANGFPGALGWYIFSAQEVGIREHITRDNYATLPDLIAEKVKTTVLYKLGL